MTIAVLFGLGVLGCGDKSPEEECQDLVSFVCDRALECIPGTEGRHGECYRALLRSAGCERVRTHSLTYQTCMESLEARSCAALFADSTSNRINAFLPPECSTAVDLMESTGQGRWITTSAAAR